MADIRIKDLATTASQTSSGDFIAIDGTTNGTRKLSAAAPAFLTSVTTPSLTSPAATNLTLAAGGTNQNVVLTPSGTGNVLTGRIVGVGVSPVSSYWDTTNGRGVQIGLYTAISESDTSGALSFLSNAVLATASDETGGAAYKRMSDGGASRIRNTFGTLTIDTAVSSTTGSNIAWVNQFTANSAGVSIASTTAGSSGAGALVVAGGISAGQSAQASYFGGNVNVVGDLKGVAFNTGAIGTYWLHYAAVASSYPMRMALASDVANQREFQIGYYTGDTTAGAWNSNVAFNARTGAATFAGAVTVGGKITSAVSTATGYNQLYDTTGLTTGRGAFGITSTGAGLAFGVESSVGGTSFTGSTAYASYFGTTTATPIHFVTNSVIRQTIDSTGAATFAGAVTINQSGAGLRLIAATAADTYLGVLENTGAAYRAAMGWTQATNVGFLGNGSGSFMTWSGTAANAGVTFAGAVAIGNTTALSAAAPSTHKVSILIGGVQYYLLASNV